MANYINAVRSATVQSAVGNITSEIEDQNKEIEIHKKSISDVTTEIETCQGETANAERRADMGRFWNFGTSLENCYFTIISVNKKTEKQFN